MALFSKIRGTVRGDPPKPPPLGQGGSMGASDQNWFRQFRQPTVSQANPQQLGYGGSMGSGQVMGNNDPNSSYVRSIRSLGQGQIKPIVGAGAGGYRPIVQRQVSPPSITQEPGGIAELIKQFLGSSSIRTPAPTAPVAAPVQAPTPASPGGLKLSSWTTKSQLPAGQRNRVWF